MLERKPTAGRIASVQVFDDLRVFSLLKDVWDRANSRRLGFYSPASVETGPTSQVACMLGSGARLLCASFHGHIVAGAMLIPDAVMGRVREAATMRISMVCVDPNLWGHGLGSLVLDQSIGFALERGCVQADLWVEDGNDRAVDLYRRHGFRPTGSWRIDERGGKAKHYALNILWRTRHGEGS